VFQLRDDHLNAFRQTAATGFEDRAVGHLRQELPTQTAPFSDGDLRQRVRSCVVRCRAYALTSERQIIRFVDTSYLIGEFFDSDPQQSWTRDVLQARDLSPDERSALLLTAAEGITEGRPVKENAGR